MNQLVVVGLILAKPPSILVVAVPAGGGAHH